MKTPVCMLLCMIVLTSASDVFENGFRHGYHRDLNDKDVLHHLSKRQTPVEQNYYVTQCGYNNTEPPSGHSINVQGLELQHPEATEKAARLIHLMVRFMPRPIFVRMATESRVGLFPVPILPSRLFAEFDSMPSNCETNCRDECSEWCSSSEHPFNPTYPISFMWAYGNFSRTFVVETNIVCQPYNPGQTTGLENLLIREYALTVMLKGIDQSTTQKIQDAYSLALESQTWEGLKSAYHYFILGTESWFNAVSNFDLGGMNCLGQARTGYEGECNNTYDQRQYIKHYDPQLYDILNHVYNNKRGYLEADTSVCTW